MELHMPERSQATTVSAAVAAAGGGESGDMDSEDEDGVEVRVSMSRAAISVATVGVDCFMSSEYDCKMAEPLAQSVNLTPSGTGVLVMGCTVQRCVALCYCRLMTP